jgi:hypothetical protein
MKEPIIQKSLLNSNETKSHVNADSLQNGLHTYGLLFQLGVICRQTLF